MNDHVTKPINSDELLETLSRWLPQDGGAKRTQAPPSPDAEAPPMPPLPGVDTAQGLSRLRGNTTLYRKLLENFAQESDVLLEKLQEDASGERFEACRAVAHNLKGVAGNIGADRLHQAFARLEQTLASGQGDLCTRLDESVREARQVIDGIRAAYPSENDGGNSDRRQGPDR